jgi:hypothetical protein
MTESQFVSRVKNLARRVLPRGFEIRPGEPLWYEITVDNRLELTAKPLEKPRQGHGAFQTDLCVFELVQGREKQIEIPRVVLECKLGLSTHDVLTYSAKARRHKQIYPYLRYGLLLASPESVPRRFFLHNESLDFFVAVGALRKDQLRARVAKLLKQEIHASGQLKRIAFGKADAVVYRRLIALQRRRCG